jgi:hypothetical protein
MWNMSLVAGEGKSVRLYKHLEVSRNINQNLGFNVTVDGCPCSNHDELGNMQVIYLAL